MTKTIQNKGLYLALVSQLNKLARHNRQGSFRTKERYYEAVKRFCAFLADAYHLQKLENISGRHLTHYVLYLQESGKSASTIKTDLAAIRFFHDKMSRPKYQLPTNDELAVELERRCFGGVDRTWSNIEFNKMLGKALAADRYDYILALYLARYAGLRIHECFRIDTAAAEQALRENAVTVKGKGGKVRTVPINEQITLALREQLERTQRGHKLLVPDEVPTDRAIAALQFFIMRHRDEVQVLGHPSGKQIRIPKEEVQRFLRHASPNITMEIYVHYCESQRQQETFDNRVRRSKNYLCVDLPRLEEKKAGS